MDVINDELVQRVTRTIAERFHPKRIMLFGSRARGEHRPDSDLDLFIEMETLRRPPERAIEASSTFGLRSWSLDLIVYTSQEVERLRSSHSSLLTAIESEGKLLYEQS